VITKVFYVYLGWLVFVCIQLWKLIKQFFRPMHFIVG
jgi:hypothetical protein